MKLGFDCLPCIYQQVLDAARLVTDDDKKIRKMMVEYARLVTELEDDHITPPQLTAQIHSYIKDVSGNDDPYREFKNENIKKAQNLYPETEKVILEHENPLEAALIMSAMGNAIDAGISLEVNIEENIRLAVDNGFTWSDFKNFKRQLDEAQKVLIIADNAGEAVFDRLLIHQLQKFGVEVVYAVRQVPILNDVTLREAKLIGITDICRVIDSGCRAPGMVLEEATEEFQETYQEVDIVISKGQGNLEGLSEAGDGIFFLLKAKCDLVAGLLEVEKDDFVFKLI